MYGLPPGIDLNFLIEKTLIQICFGQHDLVLNFCGNSFQPNADVRISVTSTISLQLPEGQEQHWKDLRQGAGFLVALAGDDVASAVGATDGTLTLTFREGSILKIYDDSRHYESYQIEHGSKTIVV